MCRKAKRYRLKSCLRRFFDAPATGTGQLINLLLFAIIVLSVLVSMGSTIKDLSPEQMQRLRYGEYFFAGLFACEYLLRLYAARSRRQYIFSLYGMVDLLAVLPIFFIGEDGSSLVLRLIRLLVLLRLLKAFRYSSQLLLLLRAVKDSFQLLVFVTIAVLILAMLGGNLMYYAEPDNFKTAFEGVWWTLVTMSTVGYGDFVPHTVLGKVLAGIGMFIGIGVFAVITAIIGSKITVMTERKQKPCPGCRDMLPVASHFCMYCGLKQNTAESAEV